MFKHCSVKLVIPLKRGNDVKKWEAFLYDCPAYTESCQVYLDLILILISQT
jgi:hypothetical protein